MGRADAPHFEPHADRYIHHNPVHHQFVEKPVNWNWSSFCEFEEKGLYPNNSYTDLDITNELRTA